MHICKVNHEKHLLLADLSYMRMDHDYDVVDVVAKNYTAI
jgi:hypothetical protein